MQGNFIYYENKARKTHRFRMKSWRNFSRRFPRHPFDIRYVRQAINKESATYL